MRWHLKGKPLKVQAEAMRREVDHERFGYWMEPGLAKTAVDINHFVEEFGAERISGQLTITPNHLKMNYLDQIETWVGDPKNLPTAVWPDEPKPTDVNFIINYEALQYESSMRVVQQFMKRHRGKLKVTTDEAHRYKTFNSNTAKIILGQISPLATSFRALTGSPVTLTVMDYWPQLRALGLLAGTNPYAFRNRFAVMGGYMGKKVTGVKNEEELLKLVSPATFRALFDDWATGVPKAISGVIGFEMSAKQAKIYKEMQQDFITMVGDEEISADMVITQMMKLQQIGRGFVLKDGKPVPIFPSHKDNPSMQALLAAIKEAPGKVIVFTIHRHTTEEVFRVLNEEGIGSAVIRGGMKAADMEREKKDFNTIAKCRVLTAQTSVAKEGHTLIGDQADVATACTTSIFYEKNYNWGDYNQARFRNNRTGQKYQVLHLDMVGSPLDHKLVKVMTGRTGLIGNIVDVLRSQPLGV